MRHQVNHQHVQYKLIVFMQYIVHHNAIHLNPLFFLCHVLLMVIKFGWNILLLLLLIELPLIQIVLFSRYKATGVAKNLEQVLQNAIQHNNSSKQASSLYSISNSKATECSVLSILNDSSSSVSILNGKRTESQLTTSSLPPSARRISSSRPLNLAIVTNNTPMEDDSGTPSSSPTNSVSKDIIPSSVLSKSSSLAANVFHKQSLSSFPKTSPIWNESVTDILLTVAKQRDTRVVKINILRAYLEEKLGVVEFLCLYRGFKSEPKLTFHGTPWEHYQCFLPVLFTLLALDNTVV